MAPKRYALTIESKKQVIEFYDKNPNVSLDYLTSYFSTVVGNKVGRTSISSIIHDRKKILQCETPHKKKMRGP